MDLLKFAFCLVGSLGAAVNDTKPPLIADLDRDLTAFYQRFRDADTDREQLNAIVDLCQLHNLVWADPRYASIEKLRGMRNRLVFQLKTAQKVVRKSLGTRAQPSADADHDEGALSQRVFLTSGDATVLSADSLRRELTNMLLLGLQYTPGSDQIAVHAGSFGGDDYGPELVALIESTIHPEHWDVNGGPGHIQYYRPVMVLVVRAGSEMHDDLTDLLQGLRENGQ